MFSLKILPVFVLIIFLTSFQSDSDCDYSAEFRSPISGAHLLNDLEIARKCTTTCQKPIFIAFLSLVSSNHRMGRVISRDEIALKLDTKFVVSTLYVDDRTRLIEPLTIGEKTVQTKSDWNTTFQIEQCQDTTQPQFLILPSSSNEVISTFNQSTAEEVGSTLTLTLQSFNTVKN